jgi:autotransporter-associated beta strand protein
MGRAFSSDSIAPAHTLTIARRVWLVLAAAMACGLASSPVHAQTTLYWGWGNTNISGSQALPTSWGTRTGTWNSTTQNWAVDATGSSYGAWQSDAIANFGTVVGGTGTVVLTENLRVSGLTGTSTNGGSPNGIYLTSPVARTLTLSGSNPVISLITNRSDAGGFLAVAGGLQLVADNPDKQLSVVGITGSHANLWFTGTATHDVNRINLVRNGVLNFGGTGTNSLSDSAAIVGRGNASLYFTRSETVGSVDFTGSRLFIDASGTGRTLNLGAITTTGGVLVLNALSATAATMAVRATSGVTKADNVSLPWAIYSSSANVQRFLQYNSTSDKFTALTTDVLASSNVATWSGAYSSSTDLYYWWGSGSGNYTNSGPLPSGLTGNLTLKTLSMGPLTGASGSNFFALNLNGNTLTTEAIAMAGIGGSGGGARIANGSITSTNGVLYVYGNGPGAEMGANLSGTMDVILSGGITLNGTSTYTGTMYAVGQAQNVLSGNGVVATGNVVLRPYARLSAGNGRIATTSVVDLEVGSELTSTLTSGVNLTLAGLTGSGTVQLGAQGNARITLSSGTDYTFAGTIAGAPSFFKSGASNFTLSGSNTYTGTTSITSGTLTIGDGGTAGSIASTGTVAITSGAVLNFNRTDNYGGAFANRITGTGSVRVASGTLALSNAGNSYTGGSTIAGAGSVLEYGNLSAIGTGTVTFTGAGSLRAGVAGTLANAVTMTSAGTLDNGGLSQTLSGVISGAGNASFAGSGTTTLSNAGNSYTGGSTIAGAGTVVRYDNLSALSSGTVTFTGAGTLRAGVGGTLANAVTMTNAGTLDNNGLVQTLSGVISGAGNVSIAGSGTTRLSNAGNSYTGGSAIAGAGTVLEYGHLNALGTGTVSFSAAGTLRAGMAGMLANSIAMTNSGTIDNGGLLQSLSGAISGGGDLAFVGSGTTTLTGLNTYTGTTNLTAGLLLVNGTNSGSGPVNVLAGAALGGTGRMNGLVDVAGALAPGNSGGTGVLGVGALTLGATAVTTIQIAGTDPNQRGVDFDAVDVLTGGLTYGGDLFFDFTFGTPFGLGTTTFDIFSFPSTQSGNFNSVTGDGGVYGALNFTNDNGLWTSMTSDPNTTVRFSQATGDVEFVVTPEPGALAIGGIGVALAAWRLRRRRA